MKYLLPLLFLFACTKPNPDFQSYCDLDSLWPENMLISPNCQAGKCNCFDECGKQAKCLNDNHICINFYTGDEILCPTECSCLNGLSISCEDAIKTTQCIYPEVAV